MQAGVQAEACRTKGRELLEHRSAYAALGQKLRSLSDNTTHQVGLYWLQILDVLKCCFDKFITLGILCLGQYEAIGAGDGAPHIKGLHAGSPGAHQRVDGAAWR